MHMMVAVENTQSRRDSTPEVVHSKQMAGIHRKTRTPVAICTLRGWSASAGPTPSGIGQCAQPRLSSGNEEGSKPLVIPPDVSQVQLEARVEVSYPRYEAVLQTAESKRIWSKGDLEAQAFPGGKRVLFYISSSLLPPGDYILTLRGLPTAGSPETVAEYSFRVETSQRNARAPVSAWTNGSPFDCRSDIMNFRNVFAIDVT